MKRSVLITITMMAVFTMTAYAGTISGKVSGVAGESVVYVEAVAARPFHRRRAPVNGSEGTDVSAAHHGGAARHHGAVPE